jgi:predicted enzyme related to lactoylglutathione lyase
MADHGTVHWSELNTQDVDKAKRFYKETLGWSFDAMPMANGTYWVAKSGDKMVGGLFDTKTLGMGPIPEHWLTYIAVDDIDKRAAKAKKAGAMIVREPFDVPGVGRVAILKEPGGAMVGWITPTAS